MHPDIKKFWENAGYVLTEVPKLSNFEWWAGVHLLVASFDESNGMIYIFNGQKYSESEALKVIKLKAFL